MARVKRARKRSMGWDVALCILAPLVVLFIAWAAAEGYRAAKEAVDDAELGKMAPAAGRALKEWKERTK